jgi:hypothetical protein
MRVSNRHSDCDESTVSRPSGGGVGTIEQSTRRKRNCDDKTTSVCAAGIGNVRGAGYFDSFSSQDFENISIVPPVPNSNPDGYANAVTKSVIESFSDRNSDSST